MATLFVRHQVADYAAWRRVYNALGPTQKALGVTAEAVYRAADDANDLTVTHEFATLEAAQAFVGSAELQTAMHESGVVGAPTIWFADRA